MSFSSMLPSSPSQIALNANRIKRKPPPTFTPSERYPPPDPTDPFAPLWVLRARTSSSILQLSQEDLRKPVRQPSYDLFSTSPASGETVRVDSPYSYRGSPLHYGYASENEMPGYTPFQAQPKHAREIHYRRRSQSVAVLPSPTASSPSSYNYGHRSYFLRADVMTPPPRPDSDAGLRSAWLSSPEMVPDDGNSDTDYEQTPDVQRPGAQFPESQYQFPACTRSTTGPSPSPSVISDASRGSRLGRMLLPKRSVISLELNLNIRRPRTAPSWGTSYGPESENRVRKESISSPLTAPAPFAHMDPVPIVNSSTSQLSLDVQPAQKVASPPPRMLRKSTGAVVVTLQQKPSSSSSLTSTSASSSFRLEPFTEFDTAEHGYNTQPEMQPRPSRTLPHFGRPRPLGAQNQHRIRRASVGGTFPDPSLSLGPYNSRSHASSYVHISSPSPSLSYVSESGSFTSPRSPPRPPHHKEKPSVSMSISAASLRKGPKVSLPPSYRPMSGTRGRLSSHGKRRDTRESFEPFDENALPTAEQLAKAASKIVIAENGLRVTFGELWAKQKTVVIFIRHFWCPLCQDYMYSISRNVNPAILAKSDVNLIIISNGSPNMIKSYRQIFQTPFAVYVDPTMELYTALGMTLRSVVVEKDRHRRGARNSGSGTESEREGGNYVRHGLMGGIAMVVVRAVRVGMPVWEKGGEIGQLGGEFVLGPGMSCSFAHRMPNTRSHAPIMEVLQAAGVKPMPTLRRRTGSAMGHARRRGNMAMRASAQERESLPSFLQMTEEEENMWMEGRRKSLERLKRKKSFRRAGSPGPECAVDVCIVGERSAKNELEEVIVIGREEGDIIKEEDESEGKAGEDNGTTAANEDIGDNDKVVIFEEERAASRISKIEGATEG